MRVLSVCPDAFTRNSPLFVSSQIAATPEQNHPVALAEKTSLILGL